jgi:hypothetical protein
MSTIDRCECLGRGPSQGPREETNELERMLSLRKSGGIPKSNKTAAAQRTGGGDSGESLRRRRRRRSISLRLR